MRKTRITSHIVKIKATFYSYRFELLQSNLNFLIEQCKLNYYARSSKKLSDPMTSSKSYWPILKTFWNNKKIPCIHYYTMMINSSQTLKERLKYLTLFCKTMVSYQHKQWPSFSSLSQKKPNKLLSTIYFTSDDILKIIKNSDPNKAHDHTYSNDKNLWCFCLQTSGIKIFRTCLENGKFPTEWKKTMRFEYTKTEINEIWKNAVQYLRFLLLEKHLKEYWIITCMNFLLKILNIS